MTAMLTESEIRNAQYLARCSLPTTLPLEEMERRLPAGSGIVIGTLLGVFMWAVIASIIYFTFFDAVK